MIDEERFFSRKIGNGAVGLKGARDLVEAQEQLGPLEPVVQDCLSDTTIDTVVGMCGLVLGAW